jgi:hypothetical protein
MVSTEVQRTLVKSPPELWAELSDAEALSRHLGQLGEIRITRLEPESEVEWEATDASGSVQIKPSAWGTRVKLSIRHEPGPGAGAPEPAESAPVPAKPQTAAAPQLRGQSPSPQPCSPPDPAANAAAQALERSAAATPRVAAATPAGAPPAPAAEPVEDLPTPTPASEGGDGEGERSPLPTRRGLLARLFAGFRRPRAGERGADDGDAHAPEAGAEEELRARPQDEGIVPPAPLALSAIEALQARFEVARAEPPAPSEPAAQAPPAAEPSCATADGATGEMPATTPEAPVTTPQAPAEPCADELETMLSAMLDSLGAAHHRPFSRA